MDRFILLALLAIPVLVIAHVALFDQRPPWAPVAWMNTPDGWGQTRLQGHWRAPDRAPSRFVIKTSPDQGS